MSSSMIETLVKAANLISVDLTNHWLIWLISDYLTVAFDWLMIVNEMNRLSRRKSKFQMKDCLELIMIRIISYYIIDEYIRNDICS